MIILSGISFLVFIFFFSLFSLFINHQHYLFIIISIELMLLTVCTSYTCVSFFKNDLYGQLFSFFILAVGAAEVAIGLAAVILYYRLVLNINILNKEYLRY